MTGKDRWWNSLRRDRLGPYVAAIRRAAHRRRLPPETRQLLVDDLTGVFMVTRRAMLPRRRRPVHEPQSDPSPPPFDIDAVFSWVDHRDPAWQQDFEEALATERPLTYSDESAYHPARFENHDELRFALRSLYRYADWFRRVVIVSAGQVPDWLESHDRITLVTHDQLLPAACLPTFNSHAIEASLHHIPGLSEHFVYLNDDFFFGRPVSPDVFFELETGRPRVFRSVAPIPADARSSPGMYAAAQRTDDIVRDLAGHRAPQLLAHAPYPQWLSLTQELERMLPHEFERTRRHRFRHVDDVSVPASLAPWYGLASGASVDGELVHEYVSVGHPTTGAKLRRLRRYRRVDTFCLNWTERTPDRWASPIRRFLERRFPTPAPWERQAETA